MDVKGRYIEEVFSSEAELLKRRQYAAIASKLHKRSGHLLSGRFYDVSVSGHSGRLSIQHPIYERFVDMRSLYRDGVLVKRKRVKIHNKFVWGTFAAISSRLMNGFTEEVAEDIRRRYSESG